MIICPICNTQLDDNAKFCATCGAKLEKTEAPVVETTAVQAPIYTQPVYQQVVEQPKSGSKAKSIVGMALSIAGIVFAAIGLLYTAIFAAFGAAIVMAIVFTLFALPGGIIGMVVSNRAMKDVGANGMNKTGKILGLISIILCGVMMLIGIATIGVSDFSIFDDDDYGYTDYYDDYDADDIYDDYF